MLAGIYFSQAPLRLGSALGQSCVCECPRAHRVAGFCLAGQPSSVPVLSLTVSMGHCFLYLEHPYSQAATVISQCQLRALMQ